MYDEHYGLSGRPVQLTPDPRFWFDTVTHKKAMAYLGYGRAQGEGFIVITGEVGAGKTTLVGHLMATIDRERLLAIRIASTQVEPDDLLRMVANGLDIDSDGMTKSQLLAAIERGLHATARAGRRTLLVVDEAQALNIAALEELRLLSNLQAGGHALLQIFLLGQPEFRERLQGTGRLEQLRQRVIAMHHLEPMGPEEVEPYMFHRLMLVGWRGKPRFTADAFDALYRGSDGVPRRLNQLAGRVMLHGAIEQLDTIAARVVEIVLADAVSDTPAAAGNSPLRAPAVAAVAPPRPLPIRGMEEPVVAAPEPAVATPEPVAVSPEPVATAPVEGDSNARIAALEARVDELDAALRRVLTLTVDWIEADQRPDATALRQAAG